VHIQNLTEYNELEIFIITILTNVDFQVNSMIHCSVFHLALMTVFISLQASFLEDVKRVLRVFVLFIPVPAFWALFDQQVSFLNS